MDRHRFLSVLSTLALLGSAAGCGQSVRPEFLDGALADGAQDGHAPDSVATLMPVCRDAADHNALFNQRCSTAGALLCEWDTCLTLVCRPAREIIDGGFVETSELRWQQRTVCNGPLPPPELEA